MSKTSGQGRPLRFLLTLLLCWTGIRVAAHLDWSLPEDSEAIAAEEPVRHGQRGRRERAGTMPVLAQGEAAKAPIARRQAMAALPVPQAATKPAFKRMEAETPDNMTTGRGFETAPVAAPSITQGSPAAGRWSASGWLLWRADGRGNPLARGGQLGGSQAGLRVDYALAQGAAMRLSGYSRVTTALDRPHAPEAAIGLALQPRRAIPVSIAAERRVALGDGGRNSFALFVSGGVGPVTLPADLRLEGYGQAGMVGLNRRDAFADGRMALLHSVQGTPLAAGISLSGGAQPGAARLDIGPSIALRLPVGTQGARLIAEWRERIAGDARPGSGPAITIAADF